MISQTKACSRWRKQRMPDSRWKLLTSVLRDTPDLNKHRTLLWELLVEGERAREAESRLAVWEP